MPPTERAEKNLSLEHGSNPSYPFLLSLRSMGQPYFNGRPWKFCLYFQYISFT